MMMANCAMSFQRSALQAFKSHAGKSWQKSSTPNCRSYMTITGHSSLAPSKRRAGNARLTRDVHGVLSNFPSCQTRMFSRTRCLAEPADPEKSPPSTAKAVAAQTADLRKTIQKKLTENLTHENIYNLPNALTFSRLILTPVIGYLVLHDQYAWAVGLFVYAGTTDLVDGWIARKWKLQTVVGSVIDPMADKLLMTVLTICLALKGALPMYIATLILGRDVSLAVAAIYYRWASLPAPKTLARYWDFSLPSAEVHPTTISKYNTALQLMLIGATTAMPLLDGGMSVSGVKLEDALTAAQWLVAGTTVWSGASYLYTRHAVKILGEKSEAEKKQILKRGRCVIAASFATSLGLALYLES